MTNNTKVLLKFFVPAIICVIILVGSSELEERQIITNSAANVLTIVSMLLALLYWLYHYTKQK